MAILDGLEILLEDVNSQEVIPDFHTEESYASSTVRCIARCVEVVNGQYCSFKVRTLPDFQWHGGDCLRGSWFDSATIACLADSSGRPRT